MRIKVWGSVLGLSALLVFSLLVFSPQLVHAWNPPPKTVVNTRTYGQCGGTVGLEGLDPNLQYEIVATTWSDGTVTYQNNGPRGRGICAQQPTPTPAPVQTPTPAPPATPQPVAPSNTQSSTNTNTNNNNISNDNQQSQNVNNTAMGGSSYVSLVPYSVQQVPAATPAPVATPTPAPAVTSAPASTPVVYQQTAAAPQVTSTYSSGAKQLPQTGVPEAAWGLTGLLPLGLKLKKFGMKKKDILDSAHSIWAGRISKKTWVE